MLTGSSKVTLDIPRDRSGTFDPKLIAKYQRRFPDFDTKIISMYARGMTVREIRGHLVSTTKSKSSVPHKLESVLLVLTAGMRYRLEAAKARSGMSGWQVKRRERTRSLI